MSTKSHSSATAMNNNSILDCEDQVIVHGHQHTFAHDRCRCESHQELDQCGSSRSLRERAELQSQDPMLDSQGYPIPQNFNELVSLIREELGDNGLMDKEKVNVERLQAIMQNYKSVEDEWGRFAFYDQYRYTRNLVDDGNGKYNLLLLCWGPNQKSPIHDHAGAHCILKVMQGDLLESRYLWPKQQPSSTEENYMQVTSEHMLYKDQAAYMHDNIGLHRVSNPSCESAAVSLHLYSPPIEVCQTFCESTGTARTSGKCVFFSVRGERTRFCASGLGLKE